MTDNIMNAVNAFTVAVAAAAQKGFDSKAPSRVSKHLYSWFRELSKNAAIHWTPKIIDVEECSFCESDAVANCIICNSPCCLAHGAVKHNAEIICDECIDKALNNKRSKKKKKGPAFEDPWSGWGSSSKQKEPSRRDMAIEFFDLDQDFTKAELEKKYKATLKKYHPDKYRSEKGKERAEAKFKKAREYYDLLIK
jgi:hypothetical protein